MATPSNIRECDGNLELTPAPDMANMHDLRRLALGNGVIKAHLDLWERGAFCSLERMLISLACHLGVAASHRPTPPPRKWTRPTTTPATGTWTAWTAGGGGGASGPGIAPLDTSKFGPSEALRNMTQPLFSERTGRRIVESHYPSATTFVHHGPNCDLVLCDHGEDRNNLNRWSVGLTLLPDASGPFAIAAGTCTKCGRVHWSIQENRSLRTCICGDPTRPGTVHRTDGPCHQAESSPHGSVSVLASGSSGPEVRNVQVMPEL